MTDIVQRLRGRAARMDHMGDGLHYYGKMDAAFDLEAADEIERLRKEWSECVVMNTALEDDFKDAADEIERLRTALDGQTRQAGKFFAENCRLEAMSEYDVIYFERGTEWVKFVRANAAHNDALEKAAKVAENFYPNQTYGIPIALAIRALKDNQ